MRRRPLVLALATLVLVGSCLTALIFWDGYYLPLKPCRPFGYPDGSQAGLKEGKWYESTTTDTLDQVRSFYQQRLPVVDNPDLGRWRETQSSAEEYRYSCYAADINGLTGETGCVRVTGEKNGTRIESWFFRGEGSSSPCPR